MNRDEFIAFVPGLPVGEQLRVATIRGHPQIVWSRNMTTWRDQVASAVREALLHQPHWRAARTDKLRGTVDCVFALPKSDPKRVDHVVRPDADKLLRPILDGFVQAYNKLYTEKIDDAQFSVACDKHYMNDVYDIPGAWLRIRR